MSSKQLARTVVEGRRVTFRTSVMSESITGYLCGMDDFHWMVITSLGEKYLLHKASAPVIALADISTYDDEITKTELERVIGPFRRFVEAEFFGRASASASAEGVAVS